jgi:acyl-coenzyme A synthetase/AMP-(fatty) acid ligase/acyl carrier protein
VGLLVVGGEVLPPSTVRLWRKLQPEMRIVNEYGPTETVVGCAAYAIRSTEQLLLSVPIGSAMANTGVYVLNEEYQPVAVGVSGELHISGMQVGRGYQGRPEMTAEKFVPDPFRGEPGARMYKTGDLGRWRANGVIEYIGRNDLQVKIRGFRIELGEIEARLREYVRVEDAAVIVREDVIGEKRLVAYYTCLHSGEATLENVNAEELRNYLSTKLPEYMVPVACVKLEKMPVTRNGKLDRKALPVPENAWAVRGYEAPVGEIETTIATIWAEVLGVERVGRYDDFFALGGHSLLAIRIVARIRECLHVKLKLRDLFEAPSISKISSIVKNLSAKQNVTVA